LAELLTVALCCWYSAVAPAAWVADTAFVEESAFGNFQNATRIYLDQQGTVFVIDRDQNTVNAFRQNGNQCLSVGGYGWSATTFDDPTGVASDGMNVYVSDYGNHRIQRFDRSLNYISSLMTRDTNVSAARFGYPLGVGLSDQGDLFVLDGENLRILKFSPSYNYNLTFGNLEREQARIRNPQKMVVTSAGTVYIGEQDRILSYDAFGNFLASIGDGICTNLVGFCVAEETIVAASSSRLWFFTLTGEFQGVYSSGNLMTEGGIKEIRDIALDERRLYILSPDKIHVFHMVIR
jgi:hypothetical protein